MQLTQREGELIEEKAEVKKLATFLKQVQLKNLTLGHLEKHFKNIS